MSKFRKETNHPILDETIEFCREELEKEWGSLIEGFSIAKSLADEAYGAFVEFWAVNFSEDISPLHSLNRADALKVEEEIIRLKPNQDGDNDAMLLLTQLWHLFTEFRLHLDFITNPKSVIELALRNDLNRILSLNSLDHYPTTSSPISYADLVNTARKIVVTEYTEKIYTVVFGNSDSSEQE